ncbi:MAG TPA: ATP-binding protein [Streptosporangiaceae bacterium]|nr:ATP-binding protein [Streptosporangiaceae bacterium]
MSTSQRGITTAVREPAAVVTAGLPGVPESVREARALVRQALGAGHPAAEAAALCASELVTNAIAYSRSGRPGGYVELAVAGLPGAAYLTVRDGGGRPGPAARAPGDGHGCGLAIVAAMSAAWGTETDSGGRVTWCVITGGAGSEH